MVNNRVLLLIFWVFLYGCDRLDLKGMIMPTGDDVDSRFEQSLEMHGSKPIANMETDREDYLFYVAADPHIHANTITVEKFATTLRNDENASFGVILGDCIDKRGCMPIYLDAISYDSDKHKYQTPIFSLVGNHDLFFAGWEDFRNLIGPSVFWFEVKHKEGKDIFVSLDSASGTLGRKQTKWLREFLAKERGKYRHCIVMTHTNILYTDNSQVSSGNLPMDETMALLDLFSEYNVLLCLQGHDHYREDVFFDGVRYTIVGAIRYEIEKPEYLCVSISRNKVEYDWRYLSK